jgi:hypothetical protein
MSACNCMGGPNCCKRVVFVPFAPHYCHLEPWRNAAGRLVPFDCESDHETTQVQLQTVQDASLLRSRQEQPQGGGQALSQTGEAQAARGRLR